MRSPRAASPTASARHRPRGAGFQGRLTIGLLALCACLAAPAQAQDTRGFLARFLNPGGAKAPARPNATPGAPAPAPSAAALSAPVRPDPRLTPGDTLDVTLEDIRPLGYSAKVRDVPVEVKRQAYANYGIRTHGHGEYEVDHLIPLSIGGSNSLKNLWPESYLSSPWNAHVKDALEYRLLGLVRAGKVDLKTAQREIATDWVAAYKRYVGPEPGRQLVATGPGVATGPTVPGLSLPPSPDRRPDLVTTTASTAPGAPAKATGASNVPVRGRAAVKVWVNTKTGVYHGPASRYYGKTKEGRYLTEAAALAAGFHAAPNNE